jgi:hypothetical protein
MGQPAYSKIYISFKNETKAKEAHKLLKKFDKIIKERWDGYSDTCNLKLTGKEISIEAHSQRVQNCEWQVERIIILLAESGGVTEFTSDLYLMGDGHYFCGDDDETFEDYANSFIKNDKEKDGEG